MLINHPLVKGAIENFKGTIPEIPDYTIELTNKEDKGEMTHEEKVLLALSYNIDDQVLELLAHALGKTRGNLSPSDKYAIPKILKNNHELRTKITNLQNQQRVCMEASMESIKVRIGFNSTSKLIICLCPGYKIILGEPKNEMQDNGGIVFPGMKL